MLGREDRSDRPVSVQEEGPDERQEALAAGGAGVFPDDDLSFEVGVLVVVVFPLPRLIEGRASLRLRFERFQGVELGILRVHRMVVGSWPVGSLAGVFEHDGFARYNLHGARFEPLVCYVYDGITAVILVGRNFAGEGQKHNGVDADGEIDQDSS